MTTVDVRQFVQTGELLDEVAPLASVNAPAIAGTIPNEAFMSLLLTMSDTRKRIIILSLLSFLAMC
jgi:hypothetical protein